jgi:hypothetical protein
MTKLVSERSQIDHIASPVLAARCTPRNNRRPEEAGNPAQDLEWLAPELAEAPRRRP